MTAAADDFPLPALAPRLRLSRAPDERGEPAFILHDPVANNYFRMDWISFECLSRMGQHETAAGLKMAVEEETTLRLSISDIRDVISFLGRNGLLALRDQAIAGVKAEGPLWKRIFHKYLFFSLPLFRPQAFLERTYKYVKWVYHPLFLRGMMLALAVMALMTLWRGDEFIHSFSQLLSPEGLMAVLLVFAAVKIVHEFAHAYTAVRYGVRVPHMGVAVMVMYPVLYTETSGSWALESRRERFNIGVAGIMAELCLAALALAVWHMAPAGGMAQALSFLVVVVSLTGSLLVNLNPLVRFDGYYMLSDATGFDNLQFRACAFARHTLRRVLFGWNDAPPENLSVREERFLTLFGAALLIYRFFLFLGIALLVYHVFFQPLGLILMVAELAWFIGLPVLNELRVWWRGRARLLSAGRGRLTVFALVLLMLGVVVPWRAVVSLPAIIHAQGHEVIFAPYAGQIVELRAREGQVVAADDILATLVSPALDHDIARAKRAAERLETLRRRAQGMAEVQHSDEFSEEAIMAAWHKLEGLEAQKQRLTMRAPFDGVIRDQSDEIVAGRFVGAGQVLMTVVDPRRVAVTAYATEDQRETIAAGATAIFLSAGRDRRVDGLVLRQVAQTGATTMPWPELASPYGGPVAADRDAEGAVTTRRTFYEITADGTRAAPGQAVRGVLQVRRPAQSILSVWIKEIASLFRREAAIG